MKIFVKGKGAVNLVQQNFVATGGQASVYIKNQTAYKIYTDPKDAIPEAKLQALKAISDKNVIKPQDIILDSKNTPVGYTMAAVTDRISLCQLFTKAYRERNKITLDQIVKLASKFRSHISNVHNANVLIVDLNELNVLVTSAYDDLFLIDVDSYQTAGYPATVIMPSVRDFSVPASGFSTLSDWFSYAILAFQLFVGSHPYRGSYAGTDNIAKDMRLEYRMRHHISAFRNDVNLPKCCYSFDTIPDNFREWLKQVLNEGKRLPPPDPLGGGMVVLIPVQQTTLGKQFSITEISDYNSWHLLQRVESASKSLELLSKGNETRVLLDNRIIFNETDLKGETYIGFTPKMNHPIGLNLYRGKLTFFDFLRKTKEELGFIANNISHTKNLFHIRNGSSVLEVEFSDVFQKIIVTASHVVADVLEHASTLFDGGVIQNMLGSIYVSLFPASKLGYQIKIPELDKYKIVDAKFDGGVLMVIGNHKGQYDRFIFRFDESFATYDIRVVSDITPSGLNFVTLDSGICILITEEEKLEAFSSKKGSKGIKVIEDKAIGNDMRLMVVNGKLGFERAGKLYQITLV